MPDTDDHLPVAIGLLSCDHRRMGGRLIGREAELERIAGAVVSARDGASRCLLVTGEAGIGKSRLVAEALSALDDALVLTGHAVDMATGEIPFGVVADTLRDLVRVAGADVLLPAERAALAPLLPGGSTGAQVERVQLLSAFLDLLERLASDRFVVWVVEDLHWADSATRDLVRRGQDAPVRPAVRARARRDPERSAEAETALTSSTSPGWRGRPAARCCRSRGSPDRRPRPQLRELLRLRASGSSAVASRVERLQRRHPLRGGGAGICSAAGRPELSTVASRPGACRDCPRNPGGSSRPPPSA